MPEALIPGCYYHIYNRGTNGENIFREDRNYRYFLKLYTQYIEPVAETFAYCLLANHFHIFSKIRDEETLNTSDDPIIFVSKQYATFFGTYAKAINKGYGRTGSLFEHPFERKLVDNGRYFTTLIIYIHRNPQTHGFVDDFRDWPWSSYGTVLVDKPTQLCRNETVDWFDGRDAFMDAHIRDVDEYLIEPLIVDYFV